MFICHCLSTHLSACPATHLSTHLPARLTTHSSTRPSCHPSSPILLSTCMHENMPRLQELQGVDASIVCGLTWSQGSAQVGSSHPILAAVSGSRPSRGRFIRRERARVPEGHERTFLSAGMSKCH